MSVNQIPENEKPSPLPDSETQRLLQQYKIYVESVERSTKRRMDTNTLFISINALMVTITSLFNKGNPLPLLLIAVTGVLFSILWGQLLHNYNVINNVKWEVIYDMEQFLPYKPFYGEWYEKMGKEDKNSARSGNPKWTKNNPEPYKSISTLEEKLPKVFVGIYIAIGIVGTVLLFKNGWMNAADLNANIAELHDALAKVNESLGDIARAGIGG